MYGVSFDQVSIRWDPGRTKFLRAGRTKLLQLIAKCADIRGMLAPIPASVFDVLSMVLV